MMVDRHPDLHAGRLPWSGRTQPVLSAIGGHSLEACHSAVLTNKLSRVYMLTTMYLQDYCLPSKPIWGSSMAGMAGMAGSY
jgi:hypothetical protein